MPEIDKPWNVSNFTYDETGRPKSLCNGKKFIYVTTAGGPIHFNFGYDYVETIAKAFFGIEDVQCIKAECLDIHNANPNEILNQVKHSLAL
jgi:FMN-dependent NADH-azoreductase